MCPQLTIFLYLDIYISNFRAFIYYSFSNIIIVETWIVRMATPGTVVSLGTELFTGQSVLAHVNLS